MRDDKDIVYIHKVDNGSSAIRMFSRIGMRLPLYCTGVGKAILATWDTAEVRDVWQHSDVHAWTEHTIVDEDAFFREIDKVRQLGYALDNEENELGVRCIAAAIPDYRGRASYAISLSAPVSRMTDQRVAELRAPLMAARDEIARALGGGRDVYKRQAVETWLKGIVSVSGLLAVMSMACVLKIKGPEKVTKRLSAKFGKLWIAAEAILFVLVGAAVDIRCAVQAGAAAVLMIALALVFRAVGVSICMLGTGLNRKERLFCVIALSLIHI